MSSEIECVDLIDSDEETKSSLHKKLFQRDEMIRCNLCLDPGLLPVEDDRSLHRISVHAAKLFYCDPCEPHEKGGKGFENFSDVVKHVCRENGINAKDIKNIHSLIRIPKSRDALKVFTCKFCSGDGMKFVGMSEDSFLEHIRNTHGNKAPRRRPDKLLRECRICDRNFDTDAELTDHVESYILDKKRQFAGFGPRKDDDYNETSEEDGERRTLSIDKRKRTRNKRKRDTKSSSSSEEEPVKLKKRKKTKKKQKERLRSLSQSETDSESPKRKTSVSPKRSKKSNKDKSKTRASTKASAPTFKEAIVQCIFCTERVVDMQDHLNLHHTKQCFQCAVCKPVKLCIDFDSMLDHSRKVHGYRTPLEQGHINVPKHLGLISCGFCSPPEIFIGDHIEALSLKMFQHLEIHEDVHRGKDNIIQKQVLYNCRLCPDRDFELEGLDNHLLMHSQKEKDKSLPDPRKSPERKSMNSTHEFSTPDSANFRSSTRTLPRAQDSTYSTSHSSSRRPRSPSPSLSRRPRSPSPTQHSHSSSRRPRSPSPRYSSHSSSRRPRSPSPKMMSHASSRLPRSPSPQATTYSSSRRPRSPSPKHKSYSSSRRPRSPSPKLTSYDSSRRPRSPSPKHAPPYSSSRKPRSPSPGFNSHSSSKRPRSPSPKGSYHSSSRRPRSPSPKAASHSSSRRPRSPSPKSTSHSSSRRPRSPESSRKPSHMSSSRRPRTPSASPPRKVKVVSNTFRPPARSPPRRASFSKARENKFHQHNQESTEYSNSNTKNYKTMGGFKSDSYSEELGLNNNTKDFECHICYATFSELFEAMGHLEEKHTDELPKGFTEEDLLDQIILPKILILISCNYCDKTFINEILLVRAELREHREVHKEIECSINSCFSLQCRMCNLKYEGLTHIQDIHSHVNTHRKGVSRLCNYCFEKFDREEIGTHMIKNHKDNMFLCHLCNNPFHDKASINNHLNKDHLRQEEEHRVINPDNLTVINCRVCNLVFYSELNAFFVHHFNKAHKDKSKLGNVDFACRMCPDPDVFTSGQELREHIESAHEETTKHKATNRTSAKVRLGERRMNIEGINKYLGGQPPAPRRSALERLGTGRPKFNKNDNANKEPLGKPRTFENKSKPEGKKITRWNCPNCEYINFPNNQECRRCQTARPSEEQKTSTTDDFKVQIELMMRNERDKREIIDAVMEQLIADVFKNISLDEGEKSHDTSEAEMGEVSQNDEDVEMKENSNGMNKISDAHYAENKGKEDETNEDKKGDDIEEPSSPEYEVDSDDDEGEEEGENSNMSDRPENEQDNEGEEDMNTSDMKSAMESEHNEDKPKEEFITSSSKIEQDATNDDVNATKKEEEYKNDVNDSVVKFGDKDSIEQKDDYTTKVDTANEELNDEEESKVILTAENDESKCKDDVSADTTGEKEEVTNVTEKSETSIDFNVVSESLQEGDTGGDGFSDQN